MIDYSRNELIMDESVYNLDAVRKYLLDNYEFICIKRCISCIIVQGRRVFTYDWYSIFYVAGEAGFLNNYHKTELKKFLTKQAA